MKKTILFFFCFLCFNHIAYPLSDFEDIKDFIEKYRTDYKNNEKKQQEIKDKISKTDKETLTKKIKKDNDLTNGWTLYDLAEANNLVSIQSYLFNRAFELNIAINDLALLFPPGKIIEKAVEYNNKKAANVYIEKLTKKDLEWGALTDTFTALVEKCDPQLDPYDFTDLTKKFIAHAAEIGVNPLYIHTTIDHKTALNFALNKNKPNIALEIINNIDSKDIKAKKNFHTTCITEALTIALEKGFDEVLAALTDTVESNQEISWLDITIRNNTIPERIFSNKQRALSFINHIKRYDTAKLFALNGVFDTALEGNLDSVAKTFAKKALHLNIPLEKISKKHKEKILGLLIKHNKPEIAQEIIKNTAPNDPALTAAFEEKTPKEWAKEKNMSSVTQLLQKKEKEKEEQERTLAHLTQALKELL